MCVSLRNYCVHFDLCGKDFYRYMFLSNEANPNIQIFMLPSLYSLYTYLLDMLEKDLVFALLFFFC